MRDPPLRGVGGGWKYSRGIEMAAAPPSVPRERGKGWGNGGSDERIFWRPPTGVNIPLQRQERQGENSSPAYLVCHRNSLKTGENYQLVPPECTSWRDTHRERVHRHGPRDFGLKVRRGEGGKTCKTHTHTDIHDTGKWCGMKPETCSSKLGGSFWYSWTAASGRHSASQERRAVPAAVGAFHLGLVLITNIWIKVWFPPLPPPPIFTWSLI